MSRTLPKILLVDDEQKFLNSIAERLKLLGFDPLKASNGPQALEFAQKGAIDLAIVDYQMPGMDGLVTITKLREINPALKTVLLTGHGNEKVKQATEALNAAYIEKDRMQDFWEIIRKSSKSGNIIVINPSLSAMPSTAGGAYQFEGSEPPPDELMDDSAQAKDNPVSYAAGKKSSQTRMAEHLRIIGETRPMQELRRNIERLAGLDCPVVIRGETGTGKELTARMIHNLSPRRQNRFTAVNCGCFSNDLLIEELFRPRTERMQQEGTGFGSDAGGTFLLDQIEDLSPKMQLSMLKIIDSNKISLQDGIDDFPFDVRIMASSHFDLGKLVEEGKFKDELYYRLNILELLIPPLRERKDDIAPLCSYFIHKFAEELNKPVEYISEDVITTFMAYDFPGNVRELEHIIERAVILADADTISVRHLPRRFRQDDVTAAGANKKFMTLAEMEKQYILEVLEATGGNKTKTTELLGISRAALWRKLKKFKEDSQHSTPKNKDKPMK
ncbi:MAG: sigma-54 dependent transcriptional regulator [Desulfobacterales bacterium]|jgi:two-component system response regulator AtoC